MSRPYTRYRNSGVEWLGDVPEHWEVAQLRRRFAVVNGGTPASGNDEYWDGETVWLTPDDLGRTTGSWISEGRRRITKDGVRNSSARVSPAGSVVLSTRAPIGHLAIAAVPATTNQGCRTLVPDLRTDSCFAYYTLFACRPVLQSLGKGSTFMELTPADLAAFAIPMPPPDEQHAIAAFLDRETEHIDALVEKKRRLIERLQEYRAALITRTVTRGLPPEAARAAGLDPSPRMKPSGVEWLGDVPEHWEVKQLRRAVVLQRGHDLPNDERETGDIPVVSSAGVSDSHSVAAGNGPAVVTGRYGSIGEFHLVDGPFWPLNTTLYSINLCGNEVRFLRYLLMNLKHLFIVNAVKSAVPGVDRNDLHPVATVLPPPTEQTAIADYLDSRLTRICSTSAKAEALIARLQEYRTALITAAVTGKIDVREAAHAPVAAATA